jgi:hypothetical protein
VRDRNGILSLLPCYVIRELPVSFGVAEPPGTALRPGVGVEGDPVGYWPRTAGPLHTLNLPCSTPFPSRNPSPC